MSRGLLITGATGKQGGATVNALLSATPNTPPPYTILAVTRSPDSPSAQALTAKSPSIKLIKGDMNDVPALFAAATSAHPSGIDSVFSVQMPAFNKPNATSIEETQGIAMIDEALKAGVKHFVYTSVERGGDVKSLTNSTNIPHFISKHHIEQHLFKATDNGANMSYTVLRPVAFMDNWVPGMGGKIFGAMWTSALGRDTKKLQLISTADIGYFAAQALLHPEKYKNRAFGLAGDELTLGEADKVFREKTGQSVPATFSFVGAGMFWGVKELGLMFRWFREEGYSLDIPSLRKEYPGLQSLGDWIEKESAFKKK